VLGDGVQCSAAWLQQLRARQRRHEVQQDNDSSAAGNSDSESDGSGSSASAGASAGLPRFGFRRDYRPVGVHLPPPPSQAAADALQAVRVWRTQHAQREREREGAAAPPGGSSSASAAGPAVAAAAAAVHRLRSHAAVDLLQHQQLARRTACAKPPQLSPLTVDPSSASSRADGGSLLAPAVSPAGLPPGCDARARVSIIAGDAPAAKAMREAAGSSSTCARWVQPAMVCARQRQKQGLCGLTSCHLLLLLAARAHATQASPAAGRPALPRACAARGACAPEATAAHTSQQPHALPRTRSGARWCRVSQQASGGRGSRQEGWRQQQRGPPQ
jgi:hypothetical protein